jgi:hypothetical protein
LRQSAIVPRLVGAASYGAAVIGDKAVQASWRMGDGATLTVASNLGRDPVALKAAPGEPLFSTVTDASPGQLPGYCTRVWLGADGKRDE